MSSTPGNTPPPPTTPGGPTPPPGVSAQDSGPAKRDEIKLVAQSSLFYWWPVWVFAFFCAAWTYFENNRLAVIPPEGKVTMTDPVNNNKYAIEFPEEKFKEKQADGTEVEKHRIKRNTKQMIEAARWNDPAKLTDEEKKRMDSIERFPMRVSEQAALGSVFVVVLLLTLVITNVPLRGLWSFIVIMGIVLIAVLITLFNGWDVVMGWLGDLRIHINMAGYVFIGMVLFLFWAVATFVFDRQTYVIFTPGQIKVCEHVGSGVETYDTRGVSLQKQRDDMFRHWVLGFGSGDLVIALPNSDKKEIRMPNVLGIGWQLKGVEEILRTQAVT